MATGKSIVCGNNVLCRRQATYSRSMIDLPSYNRSRRNSSDGTTAAIISETRQVILSTEAMRNVVVNSRMVGV